MWACAVCRRAEDEADPRCGACGSRRRIDPTARVLASNIQELTREKRRASLRAYYARKKAQRERG